jgi:hypothetical protein
MRETHTAQTSLFDFYAQHEWSIFLKNLSDRLDQPPQLYRITEKTWQDFHAD